MKKLLALLCALLMIALCASALAQDEPAPPTHKEIADFCAATLTQALSLPPVTAQPDGEGGYCHEYAAFALYSPDDKLTPASAVTAVELPYTGEPTSDMRGVGPTASLWAMLAAYPLDNTSLSGAYDEAALYMRVALPEGASYGRIVRDGARVLVAEHAAYVRQGEDMVKSCVVYTLENNDVVAVTLYPALQTLTVAQAQAELDALSALQEMDEYIGMADSGEPFSREDMTLFGVDFVSGTPQDAVKALGAATSDTYAPDGDGFIRVMQWPGAEAAFRCDKAKQPVELISLRIDGERHEGPRGLRVGDTVDAALDKFPQNRSVGALYGDGVTPPYGAFESYAGGGSARYAAQIDDQTALLVLTFVDGRLAEIVCAYL